MKYLLIILILFTKLLFAYDLVFDNNGNLIDKKLDRVYRVSYSVVYLKAYNFSGLGHEHTLYKFPKFDLNVGYAIKYTLFFSVSNIYNKIYLPGVFIGYSFKLEKPVYGITISFNF